MGKDEGAGVDVGVGVKDDRNWLSEAVSMPQHAENAAVILACCFNFIFFRRFASRSFRVYWNISQSLALLCGVHGPSEDGRAFLRSHSEVCAARGVGCALPLWSGDAERVRSAAPFLFFLSSNSLPTQCCP